MRRRKVLLALMGICSVLSKRTRAEDQPFFLEPQSLYFSLDGFKDYTFTQGKEKITLTPAEIMTALKEAS